MYFQKNHASQQIRYKLHELIRSVEKSRTFFFNIYLYFSGDGILLLNSIVFDQTAPLSLLYKSFSQFQVVPTQFRHLFPSLQDHFKVNIFSELIFQFLGLRSVSVIHDGRRNRTNYRGYWISVQHGQTVSCRHDQGIFAGIDSKHLCSINSYLLALLQKIEGPKWENLDSDIH